VQKINKRGNFIQMKTNIRELKASYTLFIDKQTYKEINNSLLFRVAYCKKVKMEKFSLVLGRRIFIGELKIFFNNDYTFINVFEDYHYDKKETENTSTDYSLIIYIPQFCTEIGELAKAFKEKETHLIYNILKIHFVFI